MIRENPDDLTPRLVYADWCDERGDPRGEFIRIQCELALLRGHQENRRLLELRESFLWEEHRREWNGEIHRRLAATPLKNQVGARRGLIRHWEYARGFAEFAIVEPEAFLDFPEALFQIGPLGRLKILHARDHIREILRSPFLPRLHTLELDLPAVNQETVERRIFAQRSPAADHVLILPLRCRQTPPDPATRFFDRVSQTWQALFGR